MERAATAAFPNEACGLLIGLRTEAGWRVIDVVDAPNITSKDPTRFFEIDPKALFETLRGVRAAKDGREVIGFFHSHPASPAVPSEFDQLQAHEAGKVWVILGGRDGRGESFAWTIRAWVSGQAVGAAFQSVEIC
ncbi:MAG: M67 family metallopeptidase [Parvibaculaceae bacterium]|nr:M67 family metallopeptidase [Parvibaculaceae bacterium]